MRIHNMAHVKDKYWAPWKIVNVKRYEAVDAPLS